MFANVLLLFIGASLQPNRGASVACLGAQIELSFYLKNSNFSNLRGDELLGGGYLYYSRKKNNHYA